MDPAPLSLVIDTDTASDDAVALLLAATEASVRIAAVTVVAGNVPLDLAVRNALITLERAGSEAPVHVGLSKPLIRSLETAQNVHGDDGMGGVGLPAPQRHAATEHAVDALRRLAREEPGVHTLVTLGPVSNIAAALLLDPLLLTRFRHTYLMLGSPDGVGNVTALGEFNAWADPEAADLVLTAPGAKTMVGWNISRTYAVVRPDLQRTIAAAGPLGEFTVAINKVVDHYARVESGLEGFDLPDPITMAIAIDPTLATRSTDAHVRVSCAEDARGQTYVDGRHTAPPPNCTVVWEADEAGFQHRLLAMAAHRPDANPPHS
jgi:purine nucleosidase